MSLRKLLGYSLQQFGKHPFLMLACCAIPHAIGIALLLTFLRIDTSPYGGDVRLTWQALSPLTKALVFLMIPLNSWLPFALGQVGVTRIAQLERNGDAVLAG